MKADLTKEKLARLLVEIKASRDGRVADYAKESLGLVYLEGQQPWSVPVDIAPCLAPPRTNWMLTPRISLSPMSAKAVAEGANMPDFTIEATELVPAGRRTVCTG